MTWFLQDATAPQEIPLDGPGPRITTFGEGLSAAFSAANRNSNVFWEFERRTADNEAEVADQVIGRLGMQEVERALRDKGVITPSMEGYDWDFLRMNTDVRRAVLELGQQAAEVDPDGWKGIDLTREGAEAKATEAQKAEAQEQSAILAMSPFPMAESIIGGIGSAIVDPRQWPLLLVNPGGSFLKVVAWQAGLSAAGEAITLPAQMETAERLDEPAPDPLAQLGIAAVAGGILGGAVDGIGRLPGLARGLALQAERARPIPGTTMPEVEPAIAAAERAIVEELPLEPAVRQVMPEPEPQIDWEAQWREADANTDWEAMFRDMESRAGEPQADTAPMPDAPPAFNRDDAIRQIGKIERELEKSQKWFSRYIKRLGGIHPDGPVADELRAADITSKSLPGLFSRKKGMRDLDNLDFSSDDDAVQAIGTDGFYLSRQGAIDALIRELSGGRVSTPRSDMLLSEAEGLRQDIRRAEIEDAIDAKMGKVALTARERQMVAEKVRAGDDPDDAIYDVLARQADEAEGQEVPTDVYERDADWGPFTDEGLGRAGSPGAGDTPRPDATADPAGNGAADAGADFSVEATPAGLQTLVPGTELRARNTERDRALAELQARQSKMRRLDQMDPDGLFAPKQIDIFDDVTSPQAKAYVDAQVAEMRASLDPEAPQAVSVTADDGRVLNTMDEVLTEIDEMDQMEAEFAACLAGGTVNVGA